MVCQKVPPPKGFNGEIDAPGPCPVSPGRRPGLDLTPAGARQKIQEKAAVQKSDGEERLVPNRAGGPSTGCGYDAPEEKNNLKNDRQTGPTIQSFDQGG